MSMGTSIEEERGIGFGIGVRVGAIVEEI